MISRLRTSFYKDRLRKTARTCLAAGLAVTPAASGALAQTLPSAPNVVSAVGLSVPTSAPAWVASSYRSLMRAPLPNMIYPPAVPPVIPQMEFDQDSSGVLGTYQPGGPTTTATSPFFQSLGTNGRACVTCHSPTTGMGLSVRDVQARYVQSHGTDPLFAPVDGATCPKNVPANRTSGAPMGGLTGQAPAADNGQGVLDVGSDASPYYLLLRKGLIRITLPVPQNAEFTVSVVSDPWGCNTTPAYDQVTDPATGVTSQIVSIYRRPFVSTNLKFVAQDAANSGILPPVDPVDGSPVPVDPATGQLLDGNIMWDGREPTLASQAYDATVFHAQTKVPPTPDQISQIVAFESGIYTAQVADRLAGSLTTNGVTGGPVPLANTAPGLLGPFGSPTETVSAFDAWNPANGAQSQRRASIYRGQQIFNFRTFTVSNVAGFNNSLALGKNNAFPSQCSTCHGQINATNAPVPLSQTDNGIGGNAMAFGGPAPSPDLPVFKLTCNTGVSTPYNGPVVLINDPGKALITGKCADIGRFTIPGVRGLAARAPYFSDGSAAGIPDVVNFYDKRFGIGLSWQDKQDLTNFLASL
jgi:cytochrome c peroxidase